MARMIATGALVGATIAACFSAPPRPGSGDGGPDGDGSLNDGARGDALGDGSVPDPDGNPATCVADNFLGTGSGTCGTSGWGSPSTSGSGVAYLTSTGTGELKLQSFGGTGGFVNCRSAGMPWNRVVVEVESVGTSALDDRTFVGMQSSDGQLSWGVEFTDNGGSPGYAVVCDDGGASSRIVTTWSPSTQGYIKVQRTAAAEMSIFMGSNTSSFSLLDTCAPPALDLDTASGLLRVFKGTATAGGGATATFRTIELCHD
jgi:hypothetical protein